MATITTSDLATWFERRLPDEWFDDIEVLTDQEEILVIGTMSEPDDDETEGLREARLQGAIARFREATRDQRVAIAREAEHTFRRRVSWGVRCGGTRYRRAFLGITGNARPLPPPAARLLGIERGGQVLDVAVTPAEL